MPRKAMSKKASRKSSKKVGFKKVASAPITGKGKYKRGPLEKMGRYGGQALGKFVGNLLGTGDYIDASGSQVYAPDPPSFRKANDGVLVTHREYLGDIISSSVAGAFKIDGYALNPAESRTFPWLSNVCKESYQQYKFEQLMFEFRTFSADALNSTNTALGSVFACVNYDAADPAPGSRQEVENTDWSRSVKPSESMKCFVECDPKQTGLNQGLLYIVNGASIPPGTDLKTYILGRFFIGTVGCQGSSVNLGSLYVNYTVKLYKPFMTRPLASANILTQAREGCNASNMFGTSQYASIYNCDSLGVTFSGNVMTINNHKLQVGMRFLLQMYWSGTPANIVTPTITHSGGTGLNYPGTGYGSPFAWGPITGTTTDKMSLCNVFVITNANQNFTLTFGGGATIPAGSVSVQIILTQINGIPIEQIGNFVAP